ncbi:MAG: redoxin domain-containing protein [Chloroflexi bacterium]|nr:redoxin domain-containing protein [Chloroflexota bacterium]
MERDLPKFEELDAQVLGMSVDSVPAHEAFCQKCGVRSYPLLSDFMREISKAYGVLRPEGFSERVTFVIDKQGVIRWKQLVPLDEQRDDEVILQALREVEGKPRGKISMR